MFGWQNLIQWISLVYLTACIKMYTRDTILIRVRFFMDRFMVGGEQQTSPSTTSCANTVVLENFGPNR